MTEEEAKTKWCPFVRVAGTEAEWHTNRPSHADVADKPFDHRIASACMAWRGRNEWFEDHGFCGLAGAPQ